MIILQPPDSRFSILNKTQQHCKSTNMGF